MYIFEIWEPRRFYEIVDKIVVLKMDVVCVRANKNFQDWFLKCITDT